MMKNKNYFTIQLIFTTIYRPHCTFWHYYGSHILYYNYWEVTLFLGAMDKVRKKMKKKKSKEKKI